MNTNLDKNFGDDFKDALSFKTGKEKIEHDAQMISFRFLSEISRLMEESEPSINKKELAEKLRTSSSYITQLFQGNKLLNFPSLAKIQEVFDVTFEIKAIGNSIQMQEQVVSHLRELHKLDYKGYWVSMKEMSRQNEYQEEEINIKSIDENDLNTNLKIA